MAHDTELDGQRADIVLDVIQSRRVTRNFTDGPAMPGTDGSPNSSSLLIQRRYG